MFRINRLFELLLHSTFFVLIILSVVLYKERLFADASYYFFYAINTGWFHVEHGRIVLGISQFFPLLAYYLGFGLRELMLIGSVGHELFYYGICLLLYYKMKDKGGVLLVLLIHLIGQLWLYYSPMLEICYGSALAVLFYSILNSGKYRDDKWLIFLLILQWFVMSSHPENFLIILFVILFDILNRGFKKRIHLITFAFFIVSIFIEILTFSEYEKGHVNNQIDDSASWLNLFQFDYLKKLLLLFAEYFPELIFFTIVSVILLFVKKSFKKVTLFLGASAALIFVVNHKAIANEFSRYYESMYHPLVFLTAFVFIYELRRHASSKMRSIITIGVFIIIAYRIIWTWSFGEPLRKRVDQLNHIVDYAQTLNYSNYIIDKRNYNQSYSHIAWSQPIEALLFSAIDGKENTVSIPTKDGIEYKDNERKLREDSTFLFRIFDIKPLSFLNKRFFELDNGSYRMLNTKGDGFTFEKLKGQVSIALNLPVDQLSYKAGDTLLQAVFLLNRSELSIPSSIESKVFISYHWYGADGEKYIWDGIRSPLEVDLKGSYIQDIKIAIPDKVGTYTLVPDLVIEGKEWFNLENKYTVSVY